MKTCTWHRDGVPARFQREPYKYAWMIRGCEACIAKFAGREIPADVMTPEQLAKHFDSQRPRTNWSQRHKAMELKAKKYPGRTTTRAA
jgi:hypothetical protein